MTPDLRCSYLLIHMSLRIADLCFLLLTSQKSFTNSWRKCNKRLTTSKKNSKADQLQKNSLSSVHFYFSMFTSQGVIIHILIALHYSPNSSEPAVCVCDVMLSSAELIDLWASSLSFASFQHLSRVQRLKAVKHRWQTLDLLTHFLHYNLR